MCSTAYVSSVSQNKKRNGIAMFAALIFIMVFMAMAAGLMSMSATNLQSADNHRNANAALNAALSGLEVAKYQILQAPVIETFTNTVSVEDADRMWHGHNGQGGLYGRLLAANLGGQSPGKANFSGGQEIKTGRAKAGRGNGPVNAQGNAWAWGWRRRENASFQLRFLRYDDDPFTIYVQSIGDDDGQITRTVQMQWKIAKKSKVLEYAVASRGRIWLDEGSVVHGPLYSTWNRPEIGPGIETSPGTEVHGTINTPITVDDVEANNIQMETLGDNGNPMFHFGVDAYDLDGNPAFGTYGPVDDNGYLLDTALNPVFDENGNRIAQDFANRYYSEEDYAKGYHENINYDVPFTNDMEGMRPEDYDTSNYKAMCSTIGSYDRTVTEYFPYAEGNYSQPKNSSSFKYTRRVYENRTFSNVSVPQGQHALFKNCTFENILFIEARTNYNTNINTNYSQTNNIRFEDCTFNGVIVTDVPSSTNHYSWWMRNSLTFTGESIFENTSSIQEATLLAPNFNINIGSTAQVGDTSNNIIKGALVGGIVDVYGNAEIHGTIISMYDTSAFTSGYITNTGDLEDGGSESNGNIEGQITIIPDPSQLLPSGIKSPVVFVSDRFSYVEVR